MQKRTILISLFLLLTFTSLFAQIGPENKNILSFLGNIDGYNIHLLGDDEKIYSLPKGFLTDKLDKGFDYLVPGRLSKDFNYVVLIYTDWDKINEIEKKLETLGQKVASLNFEGPESEHEDFSIIDDMNEMERELENARSPNLYIYDGTLRSIFSPKDGFTYKTIILEHISPSGRYLLFAIEYNMKYTFMIYDAAEKGIYDLFTNKITGSHHTSWMNDDMFTLSYKENAKVRFFTVEHRKSLKREVSLPSHVDDTGPVSPEGDLICLKDREFSGLFNIIKKNWKQGKDTGSVIYQATWNRDGSLFGCIRKGGMGMVSSISLYYPETGSFMDVSQTNTEAFFAGWLDTTRMVYGFYDFMNEPGAEEERGLFVYEIHKKKEKQLYNGMVEDYPMLACPYVYIFENNTYHRIGEILPGRIGKLREGSDLIPLVIPASTGSTIRIKISEELAETSYIDTISLVADGTEYRPVQSDPLLNQVDGKYLILTQGTSLELVFQVPPGTKEVNIYSSGYYDPVYLHLSK